VYIRTVRSSAVLLIALACAIVHIDARHAGAGQGAGQDDRDGFDLRWTPDGFIESGFGSTTSASLWQFYDWRPGLSREQFLRAVDSLITPPPADVREALLAAVWQPHRERMLSLYTSGAGDL